MDKIGQSLRFSASSSFAIGLEWVRSDSQSRVGRSLNPLAFIYGRVCRACTAASCFSHFAENCFRVSLLIWLTPGNRSRHSYGRVASMIIRELWPFWPGGIMGSRGPLQVRRRISTEVAGSERVAMAQTTSFRSVMSMSSSTTTT